MHTEHEKELKLLKTEKKVVGIKQTKRNISDGNVKAVFVAMDADPMIINPIINECNKKKIEIIRIESSSILGKACSIDINCAVSAILK